METPPSSFCPLPGHPGQPLGQLQASRAGLCPQCLSGRLAQNKAGTGGGNARPAHGSVSSWAPSGLAARGGLAAAGAGGPGSPSPAAPGTVPARASGFSGCQRGWGGLAGLRGWAGGFPLWALLPPGSFPNANRTRRAGVPYSWPPHHPHWEATPQALPPPPTPPAAFTSAPYTWSHSSPRAFALAVPPPAWHTLTQNPLWLPHFLQALSQVISDRPSQYRVPSCCLFPHPSLSLGFY